MLWGMKSCIYSYMLQKSSKVVFIEWNHLCFLESFTDTNTYTSKNKQHLHSTLHVPGIALLPLLCMKRPRGRFYLSALFYKRGHTEWGLGKVHSGQAGIWTWAICSRVRTLTCALLSPELCGKLDIMWFCGLGTLGRRMGAIVEGESLLSAYLLPFSTVSMYIIFTS